MTNLRIAGTLAALFSGSVAAAATPEFGMTTAPEASSVIDIPVFVAAEDGQSSAISEEKKAQVIKTLQKKTFTKNDSWEISPHLAFVANDPFLNRYIFGVGVGYSLTEVFAIEGMLDYSPDLGDADWKPLTTQLVTKNSVSPDISKLGAFGSLCFVYSPIYGKAAILGRNIVNFDIYGKFGFGATQTKDDLTALDAVNDPKAISTQTQIHPTSNFGAGARVIFNNTTAARLEGRSMIYIETVNATTLEMKNNFLIQMSVSK